MVRNFMEFLDGKTKKLKKLLIGTNNKGKLREIRDLLPKSY